MAVALQQPRGLLNRLVTPSRALTVNLHTAENLFHLKGGRASLSHPPRRLLVAPLAAKPDKDDTKANLESFLRINEIEARWESSLIGLNALSSVLAAVVVLYNINLVSDFPIFTFLGVLLQQ